jgi:nitrous oxidase accessory protein NosD
VVSITKSFIHSSKDYGVHLLPCNGAKLIDNIISDNKDGICIEEGSLAEIHGNLIEKNERSGIIIVGKGGGVIDTNVIRDNKTPIIINIPENQLTTVINKNTIDPSKFNYS